MHNPFGPAPECVQEERMKEEVMARQGKWDRYIEYLRQWADDHADIAYANQSPACYDEWCDMESKSNE